MKYLKLACMFGIVVAGAAVPSYSQKPEKTDAPSSKTTTLDAWRNAVPQSEVTSVAPVLMENADAEVIESASQIKKRILDLEQRFLEAIKSRDADGLNALLADKVSIAGVDLPGNKPEKIGFIDWAQKRFVLKEYLLEKTSIQLFGSVALVSSVYKRQASLDGAPSDGDFVVTNVWAKTGKEWQAVSHHISPRPTK
jgi:ketosteroid isomerase-like protein